MDKYNEENKIDVTTEKLEEETDLIESKDELIRVDYYVSLKKIRKKFRRIHEKAVELRNNGACQHYDPTLNEIAEISDKGISDVDSRFNFIIED